jgi:hypothetical protein
MRYSYSLCALCFVLSILTPDVARAQTLADCSKIDNATERSKCIVDVRSRGTSPTTSRPAAKRDVAGGGTTFGRTIRDGVDPK